jgi:hypothetical protein
VSNTANIFLAQFHIQVSSFRLAITINVRGVGEETVLLSTTGQEGASCWFSNPGPEIIQRQRKRGPALLGLSTRKAQIPPRHRHRQTLSLMGCNNRSDIIHRHHLPNLSRQISKHQLEENGGELYIKYCRYETLSEKANIFGNHGVNRNRQEILTLDVESK